MSERRRGVGHLIMLLTVFSTGCAPQSSDLTTANKEVVRQWFAALDAQDFDALTDLMDEQFVIPTRVIDGAPRAVGRDATFELIRGFYRSFPDYTHDIEELIAEGDRVAAKVVLRGTHLSEYLGVAPTGIQVSYAGTYMMTVIDGVLTEVWSLDDVINVLSQLGMEPAPVSTGS
jgi:predicted ester cyclase